MKKTLAIVLSIVMMLAMCTVFAGAVDGKWGTSADDFAPVGELEITYDTKVSTKIKLDGDMTDWAEAGYTVYEIAPRNMVSWVGDVDPNWGMKCYFVGDSERLYVGFFITDSKVAFGDNLEAYNGDAFQMAFDWGRNIGDYIEAYPDALGQEEMKDIFYSFCMSKDGDNVAPIKFMRDDATSGGRGGLVYDGNEDPGEENEYVGMAGAAGLTEDGWCAEFSVTWERLNSDAKYKLYDDKFYRTAAIGPDQDLKIGCSLYYLNRDEDAGAPTFAAGTMKGMTSDAGVPQVTWTAMDDGLSLVLKWKEGMTFSEASGIRFIDAGTEPDRPTEEETTAAPTEAPTAAPTEEETTAATTGAATTAPADGAATTVAAEEGGCSSMVGAGAIAVVLSAAAAAVALKKKH